MAGAVEEIDKKLAGMAREVCGVCRAKDWFCPACPMKRPGSFLRFLMAEPKDMFFNRVLHENLKINIQKEMELQGKNAKQHTLEKLFKGMVGDEVKEMLNAGRPAGEVKALALSVALLRVALNLYRVDLEERRGMRVKGKAGEWVRVLKEDGDG